MKPILSHALGLSCLLLLVGGGFWAQGQEASSPVKVSIKDGKVIVGEPTLPLDPTPRCTIAHSGQNNFGLMVDGNRLTFSPNGSIWTSIMVDGSISNPFNFNQPQKQPVPLPPTVSGRKRHGTTSSWDHGGIKVTQILEIVPSKPSRKVAVDAKRRLDTCRTTYILENKTQQTHKVALRTSIDILIVNNDGALYASPTTQPGKILNGVALQGKELPEYLWVLQNADLNNPGFVATMTLKHTRGENPNKIVLTNLGVVGNVMQWDVQAVPAGDSACALFWEEKELKPGQKRELVWGYGGGISTSPENEGRVRVGLSGNFEPNKLFTIAAEIEDPTPDQSLALELPAGLERVEGREIQPVAQPTDSATSFVLWKGRVVRPGDYEIIVRSSTGSVQSKHVKIEMVK
jgi:hypothetical protein